MSKLLTLPNIGKVLEVQLFQVGIETAEQLQILGSKQAWTRLKEEDPSTCYSCLCALEGAIQGIRWHDLHDDVKQDLKIFFNDHK